MQQHRRIGGCVLSAVSPRTGIFAVRKGSFLPDFTASRLSPAEGGEENGSGEERFPSADLVRKEFHEPKVLGKASRALEGIVAESFAGKQEGLVLKVAKGAAGDAGSSPLSQASYPAALPYLSGGGAKALSRNGMGDVLPPSVPVQPLWMTYARPTRMSYAPYGEARFRYDADGAPQERASPAADYREQSGKYPVSPASYGVSNHLRYRKAVQAFSGARQQESVRVEYAAQQHATSQRAFEPRRQNNESGDAYRAEANGLPYPIKMAAEAGKQILPCRATAANVQFRYDAPKELRPEREQRMRQADSAAQPVPARRDDNAYLQRVARSGIAVRSLQRVEVSAYPHFLQTKAVRFHEPARRQEMPNYKETSVIQPYRVSSLEGSMTTPYVSASSPSMTVIPAKSPAFALDSLVMGQPLRAELKNLDGLLKGVIPIEPTTARDYAPKKEEQRSTYRDIDGSVVKDAYVALDYSIKESDMARQGAKKDYLSFAKERLRQLGHNVDIETRIYNGVKARMLVNKDDPNRHFHILINGKLPEFKDGGENPAALLYLKEGATLQVIEHGNILPYIKAWENPLVRQCTTGRNNYKK